MLIITCQNSEQVFAEFMDRKFVIENKNNLNEFSATIKNCLNDFLLNNISTIQAKFKNQKILLDDLFKKIVELKNSEIKKSLDNEKNNNQFELCIFYEKYKFNLILVYF